MIMGIDEAGRGPWAGPLVVAAVILRDSQLDSILDDSKKLTDKSRQALFCDIQRSALYVGVGFSQPAFIDLNGLTSATTHAMKISIRNAQAVNKIIIDGNFNYLSDTPNTETLIKADALVPAVSAASIVAKVFRDRYMTLMDQVVPGYYFSAHKGYGTAMHKSRLNVLGASSIHRMSFKPVYSA